MFPLSWSTLSRDGLSMSDGITTDNSLGEKWVLIATCSDLRGPRALMPITLGEKKFILFRNENGEMGLIGRYCPHRGADLCYGRLENLGIRCPFHGWHFDMTGQCIEQPAEPEGSQMYKAIKVPMVPIKIEGEKIYASMG